MHNYSSIPKYMQLYAIFGKETKTTVTWVIASFDNPLPMQLIISHETLPQTPNNKMHTLLQAYVTFLTVICRLIPWFWVLLN